LLAEHLRAGRAARLDRPVPRRAEPTAPRPAPARRGPPRRAGEGQPSQARPMNATLTVGDLHFELRRSPRPQTMQITIDRSGELVLIAPEECGTAALERFVREKRFWIYTKLAEKESQRRSSTTKEFVSGEGFPYRGKSYRLLLVDHQDVPLKLD